MTRANPSKPRPFWRLVNTFLVLYAPWTGYSRMSPSMLQRTNPDVFYCLTIVVTMPLLVLGTLAISRSTQFLKPSWDRSPLLLWSDPLQSFFVGTCVSLGVVLGSALRLPQVGTLGFWTLLSFLSVFIGLLIGQVIAYWVYRHRITA